MPDSSGMPTKTEIDHFELVLNNALEVLGYFRQLPTKEKEFDRALKELKIIYASFDNEFIHGMSHPLFDVPTLLSQLKANPDESRKSVIDQHILAARKQLVRL